MTIIARHLPPLRSLADASPTAPSGPARDRVVDGQLGPFASSGVLDRDATAASSRALVEALRARVRQALDATSTQVLTADAVLGALLDAHEAQAARLGAGGPVGNTHPLGSPAWFEAGRRTGVWFAVPMDALRALVGHGLRPDPERAEIDRSFPGRPRAHRPQGTTKPGDPSGDKPAPPRREPGIDVREPGVRTFEQEVVLAYLRQLGRASVFLSRAAAVGAERPALQALAEAALRRERLDLHVGPDVGDRLEEDNAFDREVGRAGVANQAFWLQLRAGDEEVSLGNVHDLLPGAPPESFRRFAQDSRIRLNVEAAGDRMMRELHELAQGLNLDVFDEPQKRRERVAAAIGAFARERGSDLVRLGRGADGPDAMRRVEAEVSRLLDLAATDLEALERDLR